MGTNRIADARNDRRDHQVIQLATAIALRDGHLLMVASRYPNQAQPLWNLPGGRQLPGELLSDTVVRETLEETGLSVLAREVAYVSESYDGAKHFLNVTFHVTPVGESSFGEASPGQGAEHVVEAAWVPLALIGKRIAVAVVREPLIAYLSGELLARYAGYPEAGITIEWPADSR